MRRVEAQALQPGDHVADVHTHEVLDVVDVEPGAELVDVYNPVRQMVEAISRYLLEVAP